MLPQSLVLVAALAVNTPQPPALAKNTPQLEPEVGDITGYFNCKGQEASGKTYSGVAAIYRKGDVYIIQWMVGSGSTFTGIGVRQGNTLSASWAMQGERGLTKGVNVYRIEPASGGPRFSGRWATMPGNGVLQTETLTFLRQMDEDMD